MPRTAFLFLFACLIIFSCKPTPASSSARLSKPEKNFEIFWRTFQDNYAFFELHDVNWKQQYDIYRSKVNVHTTRKELGAVFAEMLAPLHDGHVTVAWKNEFYFKGQSQRNTFKTAFKGLRNEYTQITAQVLLQQGFEPVKVAGELIKGEPWLRYTKNANGTGYLSITRFFNSISGVMGSDKDQINDQKAMLSILGNVMNELSECNKLIIDLRTNGGGHSGRECAAMFVSDTLLTHYLSIVKNGAASPPLPQYISPATKQPYTQELVLLTSDRSASSAEDFVLGLDQRNAVTIIGTSTAGMLSDMYNFSLPNGIQVTLSNQRYYDYTGKILLEGKGISPDIEVPYSSESITEKKDPQLNRALEFLKNGK